jgi:hypothetical protein
MKLTERKGPEFRRRFCINGVRFVASPPRRKKTHTADALFDRACERLVVCGWKLPAEGELLVEHQASRL